MAKLQPIELDGSIVSAATLHNAQYIVAKDIRVNDWVKVFKAGEIIPKIIGPVLEKRSGKLSKFVPFEKCPICGSRLEKINDDIDQYCINNDCKAKSLQAIIHYVSRDCMNIEGLSIKIIEKLEMENKKLMNNYNNLSTYLSGLKVDFDKVKMEKLRNYFKEHRNSQKEENNIE